MQTILALTVRLTAGTEQRDEDFDAETLALMDELDVPFPDLGDDLDLDVVFGTPLEMYEPAGTDREMRRYAAAIAAAPADRRYELALAHGAEIAARLDAGRDIVATDPTVTALVRERLLDVLLPHAARLRRTIRPGRRAEPAAA
ncbi:hypothetical protein [Streptomyces exfoliatus]|uniref:hypothetical protein n=1 Tax=Streptomyces exfoliatus TaxID=1905 RepID=UPI00068C7CED|nr:hypothetical protein [Streptomyces exfoliatus]